MERTLDAAAEPAAAEPAAAGTRRRPRGRVFGAAFAVGLGAVVVASSVGVAAWDASYDTRILPGVHVGGIDLSGLDRATAGRALTAAFPYHEGRIVLGAPEGDIVIPYSAFGRRADIDTMVDEAMRAGRAGSALERAVGEVRQAVRGTTLEPRLALDEVALEAVITSALAPLGQAPVDASVVMGDDGPVTTPAVPGRRVDPAPVVAEALAGVRAAAAPAEIRIPVRLVSIDAARGDDAVRVALVRAQRVIRDVVIIYGKKTWTIEAAQVRSWVSFEEAADGSLRPVVDTTHIADTLGDVAKGVRKPGVSASFLKTRGGTVIGAVAGKDGRQLNVEKTVARVALELQGRADGDLATPIRVAYGPLPPDLTTEEATEIAPLMVRLGAWTTWFPISERNFFGANIWRPAQIINGTVLMPGQRFEWWSAIGPVTSARGFGPGGVIRSDFTDPTGATGGGMCSSSTTLFNAALRAGLRINARSNHKYYINRYPLGLDATVSIVGRSVQTMSFTNDTGHPVYIRGIRTRSGGRGFVTYEIWGVPDGRTVALGRAVVSNVRKAITREVIVDTLPHGVREQTEYPSNGMDVSVTRVVRNAAGSVIHRETFSTHYVLWNGRIEVGR